MEPMICWLCIFLTDRFLQAQLLPRLTLAFVHDLSEHFSVEEGWVTGSITSFAGAHIIAKTVSSWSVIIESFSKFVT